MTGPAPSLTGLSAVKLSLMAKQARAQMGAIARAEPIAVIGMGCRFPGGADSPDAFWALLRDGRDAVGEIPRTRWDVDAFYDADPAVPGKLAVNAGGFLRGVDEFDAAFFGIMRREAERMDPQHRVFLEVAVDALDHAGMTREALAGSRAGVFIASYHSDYNLLQFADRDAIDARTLTGTQHSVLANRLSYLLDLRGPSISIDTACSSSLVAIHLACQSLRTGESDVVLAGGVSLMLSPEMMITLSKVGFMSPTGRCRTFDARADGFIRGEGCGVVVLKRLSDAIADGDRVLSVIRGTAVNQDGHSTVLAAPNGLAQQALVRDALANAQLTPDRVGFVETHGTATPLGDPIEVEALAATLGAPRADGSLCYLGSAKANLGHMEAASGVAGLIKATLVLQHGEIPRQVHFTKLNPHITLAGTCLAIADAHRAWPAGAAPRVAGVSGFGVGGTNAHVLVEEAPAFPAGDAPPPGGARLLPLSAQTPAALRALAEKWIPFLESGQAPLSAICATAGTRRSHYDHRVAVTAETAPQMAAQLHAWLHGDVSSAAVGARAAAGGSRIAFAFSGQGPQWAQMGCELAAREPVFHDTLAALDARFALLGGWSLRDALAEPAAASRIMETEVAQPAIFALQLAQAALWASWGVTPDVVVGHSIGELAAMTIAGVLSLDDAVRIVFHRGRIMQRAAGHGRMAAVGLTAADASALVCEIGGDLSVAAVNGPRSTVLSGSAAMLDAAMAALAPRDVQHRVLPVDYAFHSTQMTSLAAELVSVIGTVATHPARIALYSSVTGARIEHTSVNAAYFGRNVRETVQFAPAVDAILASRVDAFVELAPHPVLAAALAECIAERATDVPVLSSMRRGRGEHEAMLQACAGVYVTGLTPHWSAIMPPLDKPIDLPSYPWQRERYWLREFDRLGAMQPPTAVVARSLLGVRTVDQGDGSIVHEGRWPAPELAWLSDHRIGARIVMPGAAMLELLRAAASDAVHGAQVTVSNFVVNAPLLLPDTGVERFAWQTVVIPDGATMRVELRAPMRARSAGEAVAPDLLRCVASADAAVHRDAIAAAPEAVLTGHWQHDADALYARFATLGVQFGSAFRAIDLWRLDGRCGEALLVRRADVSTGASPSGVHPAVLDGALQLCVMAMTSTDDALPGALMLPLGVDSYTVFMPVPTRVRAVASVERQNDSSAVTVTVVFHDDDGARVAEIIGARFATVDAEALANVTAADDDLYEIIWRRSGVAIAPTADAAAGRWIVLTNGSEVGRAVIAAIDAAGGTCDVVRVGSAADRDGWCVVPHDTASIRNTLRAIAGRAADPVRGILHLFSADAATDAGDDADADWLVTGSALLTLQALAQEPIAGAPLWLVTHGAQPVNGAVTAAPQAGLWGLARVAGLELVDLDCRVVDLEPGPVSAAAFALVAELVRREGIAPRIALRGGDRFAPCIARYRPHADAAVPSHARLALSDAGTLESLRWEPATFRAPDADEVRLQVLATGVNFRDVLLALGMYPGSDGVLGAECVGIVDAVGRDVTTFHRGDRVFGFAPGSMATSVTVPAAFLALAPDDVSDAEAAALPVAFLTAMFGLYRTANIARGTKVLVHAAAGGVGLAAVQLVQRAGGEVFATAGSPAKRAYLHSIGVQHVFDSRSLSFADDVLAATDGKGVDVVLNSLAGDFIPASVRALAHGGWMLELGKRDVWTPERMTSARPDVRYCAYDLGAEAHADRALLPLMLAELRSWLADGSLHLLPTRSFEFAAVSDAMRVMAQARHIGKLVLRAPAHAARTDAPVVRGNATYLITGGTGAVGVRTARWLVAAGARSIVLTGRHAPGAESQAIIDACRAAGADVQVRAVDASDDDAMAALFRAVDADMPPLRGVVHAAGVVDDGVLLNLTWDRWRAVLQGKARGARVLDALTQHRALDFFILYSAAGLHLGPPGQGPYAAANAELEALASARRDHGLPALSIAWGLWPDAGMAAELAERGADGWSARGLGWIDPDRAFDQVAQLLSEHATQVIALPIDWAQFLDRLPAGEDRSFYRAVEPMLRRSPSLPGMASTRHAVPVVDGWRAAPTSARRDLVIAHVLERTRQVLGVDDLFVIPESIALKDVGLDSLMAVELRNVLTRSLGKSLPATLLFDYPSLDALSSYLLRTFELLPAPPTAVVLVPSDATADVATLSDDEAEALLLAELNSLDSERRR